MLARQQTFLDRWLVDGNISESYRQAGYKTNSPNVDGPKLLKKLLANPSVREYVDRKRKEQSERFMLEEDYELKKFIKIANVCEQKEDYTNLNRALENVGKLRGKYTDKIKIIAPVHFAGDDKLED